MEIMREKIFEAKPVFAHILKEKGQISLFDYFQREESYLNISSSRKEEFLQIFEEEVSNILGGEVASRAAKDLALSWYVSTADHHGLLSDPYFFSSALVESFATESNGRSTVIALPCGGISIDNATFPRGLVCHNSLFEKIRFHIISRTISNQPVFSRLAYTENEVLSVKKEVEASSLDLKSKEKIFSKIIPIFEEALHKNFVLFSDQSTYINFHLWKMLPGLEKIDLVYIEQETLVRNILLKNHINQDTILNKIISNPKWLESFERNFNSISGAHDTKGGRGTFLFWAIDGKKRIPLDRQDSRISDIQKISEGLKNRTLMPAMSLTYITLAFYYGLSCGGGFSQVNYLTEMKKAYMAMFLEMDEDNDSFDYVSSIPTDFFCGDLQLATISDGKNNVPASILDTILYGNSSFIEGWRIAVQQLNLKDAVEPLFPELYRIIAKIKISPNEQKCYTASHIYEKTALSILRIKSDKS